MHWKYQISIQIWHTFPCGLCSTWRCNIIKKDDEVRWVEIFVALTTLIIFFPQAESFQGQDRHKTHPSITLDKKTTRFSVQMRVGLTLLVIELMNHFICLICQKEPLVWYFFITNFWYAWDTPFKKKNVISLLTLLLAVDSYVYLAVIEREIVNCITQRY